MEQNLLFKHIKHNYIINEKKCNNIVTEMFGISEGYKNKIIDIDVPLDFEILYITGESGSGKTTILNYFKKNYKLEDIPYDLPLYLWGGNEEQQQIETMKMLSLVGLSDCLMFINTYDELSDSQKARARIYLELISNKNLIVIDEFLSTLDRKTAKCVAYSIQKTIRKYNKKLIVATAHEDLEDFLKPDYVIKGKSFPSRFEIYSKKINHENPFLKNVVIYYGTKEEYKNLLLGELHYKGKYTGGTKEYLYAKINDEIIGVLVSTYNMHTKGRRISRVVIHPSYRGIGIAKELVKKYINDFDNVDVVATMALYNPFFEKAGMKRIEDSIIKSPKNLQKILIDNNFDINKWHNFNYCFEYCKDFKNRKILSEFSKFTTHLIQPGGKKLKDNELKFKIIEEIETASRILYQLRPRKMAKLISNRKENK